MTELNCPQPEIPKRKAFLLKHHIAHGIELIKQREGKQAYNHFAYYQRSNKDAPFVILGMIFPITKLLSEEDLVSAASTVASHSRGGASSATIGGWYVGREMSGSFDENPALYKPEFVEKFYHEVSVIAAEEWLHMLQQTTNSPLAGQTDKEVDVAAYLDTQSIYLSADFITRCPQRAQWYLTQHPEREEEILEFDKKYRRSIK